MHRPSGRVSGDRFSAWVCGDRSVLGQPAEGLIDLAVGVKDVIATSEFPTRLGGVFPPAVIDTLLKVSEAACVTRLKSAGAVVGGKTVTAELATYEPGATVNPLAVDRTPGGSSSGSAAAVAAGDVRLAIATQTAGSTIRPASFCGTFGYKPSFGRYNLAGVLQTSPTLDTLGLIADRLPLIAAADAALQDFDNNSLDAKHPKKLVLYRTGHWDQLPESHQRGIEALAERLAAAFVEYQEQDSVPALEALVDDQRVVHAGELAAVLGWLLDEPEVEVSPAFHRFVAEGKAYLGDALDRARANIVHARERAQDYIKPGEVWLTPSVVSVAPLLGEGTGDPLFCRQWTALGVPCLSMPLLREEGTGLPYGPQFIMSATADRDLLAVGTYILSALKR